MGEDPFAGEQKQNNSALRKGGNNTKGTGQQGQHSAGTGGGGDGSQSAWEHESGGANRRDGGEKKDEERRQLLGEANPDSEQEASQGDLRSRPYGSFQRGWRRGGKEPSYMHSGEEQEELKDKWKDLSERILVDLQTSSKEWGENRITMLQGVKRFNRDKYDYSTFLRKFATMREDIQINPEEFDYVYYTFEWTLWKYSADRAVGDTRRSGRSGILSSLSIPPVPVRERWCRNFWIRHILSLRSGRIFSRRSICISSSATRRFRAM